MSNVPLEANAGVAERPVVTGEAPAPTRTRRLVRRLVRGLVMIAASYYALCLVLLGAYRFVSPPITGLQLQRRVQAIAGDEEYQPRRRFVAYDRLPAHVPRAVIAAEDGSFWEHYGFDFKEMKIASAAVFDGEMPRGASTITQQLMKNLFGGTTRNPIRKLYDMSLTPPAELLLGKERILELYLNNVEWGPGIYGIEAAARYHYGRSARELTRSQAAGLAALLPNPRQRTPENTAAYRSEILRRMTYRGW